MWSCHTCTRIPKGVLAHERTTPLLVTFHTHDFQPNLLAANLPRNFLKINLSLVIRSITVRAGARVQDPGAPGAGRGVREAMKWGRGGADVRRRAEAAAHRWEDGAVIRPSRWLELSRTA